MWSRAEAVARRAVARRSTSSSVTRGFAITSATTSFTAPNVAPGATETYPMVELKLSIERDEAILEKVMDAIHYVHHYEEPVIFLRENWVSRANYNPDNSNPNRFWNNGRGLPKRIEDISAGV